MDAGDDRTSQDAHPSILDTVQRERAYPLGTERHFWNRGRCRIVEAKLPDLRPADLVLDLGCGPGATVEHLRRRGVDCVGCDLARYTTPASGAVDHVFYETDAAALPGELKRRVRVILLLDVLEHLAEPAALLERCGREFDALEYILMTMPARRELWTNFDEYYGHLRRYDASSLRALCREAELQLDDMGYWFHGLYVAVAFSKWVRRERDVDAARVGRGWLHELLGYLFYLEERWLPARLPGTTIYALTRVARRG